MMTNTNARLPLLLGEGVLEGVTDEVDRTVIMTVLEALKATASENNRKSGNGRGVVAIAPAVHSAMSQHNGSTSHANSDSYCYVCEDIWPCRHWYVAYGWAVEVLNPPPSPTCPMCGGTVVEDAAVPQVPWQGLMEVTDTATPDVPTERMLAGCRNESERVMALTVLNALALAEPPSQEDPGNDESASEMPSQVRRRLSRHVESRTCNECGGEWPCRKWYVALAWAVELLSARATCRTCGTDVAGRTGKCDTTWANRLALAN